MNRLRRWIDRGNYHGQIMAYITSCLISFAVYCGAMAPFFHWWPILAGAPSLALGVWLFVACGTNWRWDGL